MEVAKATEGMILYVPDIGRDMTSTLDSAWQIAVSQGIPMELVHIVDLSRERSHPDGQMGIQFRLDALANSLRRVNRKVAARLLFGSPEDVICKRAREVKARLIALPSDQRTSRQAQEKFVKQLERKAGCPVMLLSAAN